MPGTLEHMVQYLESDGRKDFAARLLKAATEAGYPARGTAARLATEMGISERGVGKWLGAETMPDTKRLERLANLLGVSAEWLLTGREHGFVSDNTKGYSGNSIGDRVPVIAWPTVAVVSADRMVSPATMAIDWRPCPVPHGQRTYFFEVPDDAMTSSIPKEKTYPAGCLVAVDPDAPEPESGKPVVARFADGSVTLRLLMKDAGRRWLRAINSAYLPIVDVPFEVVGTVKLKMEEP